MPETPHPLDALRRPRLLILAARFGLEDYNRDRDLRKIFKVDRPPTPALAVSRLMEEEAALEETRVAGAAGYSVARHIAVLIALIGETRLLPARG